MTQGRFTRRRILQASGVAIASGLAGCGDGGGATTTTDDDVDADTTVSIGGDPHWNPQTVSINAGQTVLWEVAEAHHNIVPQSEPEDSDWSGVTSDIMEGDETHDHEFLVPGTYEYQCSYHSGAGLGTLEVTE